MSPIERGPLANLEKNTESDLSSRLLTGIASSAEDLTNGRGWPDAVHSLLQILGEISGVSRVWIFQTIEITEEYIIQDYAFEWAAKPQFVQIGMRTFSMFRTSFNNQDYKDLIESRKRGEWQKVITRDLAPSPMQDSQIRQGIQSMLTIPIIVEGQWWGVLGFDDCEREYDWSLAEIALLRTATFLISNAIIRDRLGAVRKQFTILQSITESNAWEFNLKKARFWCPSSLINSLPGTSRNIHLSTRGVLKLVHHDDRRTLIDAVKNFIAQGKGTFRHDLRIYAQCGQIEWIEVIGKLSKDPDGSPEQFAGIAVDIGHRKYQEEALREQATHDHLTGVMNRASFEKSMKNLLGPSSASKSNYPLSLLILDLDHFKNVNDTWGHDVGDRVLRDFVVSCQQNLREGDILARIGGEEFAILLPSTGSSTARKIGNRIRSAIEKRSFTTGEGTPPLSITTSIGCTTADSWQNTSPDTLFKCADNALYSAKNKGRNRLIHTNNVQPPEGQ